MSEPVVHYRTDGPVAILTLDAPPANCYSHALMLSLDDAILQARFDDEVEVIVVTGAGTRFFCAGADIAMLSSVTPRFKYYFCLHANETLSRLEHTDKLVIAAVNGHCVGGGLEVAMACDLRVARKDGGSWGLPEVKLGVLPGTGGTQRLARLVGHQKALRWMVEGKTGSFDEAEAEGVFDRVLDVPAEDFLDAAVTYAKSLCTPGTASMAVGHIKRAVQTGAGLPLEQGLALERELQAKLFGSDDAVEGLNAYVEKRKARFSGS
ncbi:MAG: enoyl-CoA hydratase/isomerase family protein [Deltaproteobacteria bacterium]|nr:enoyl-CoA hydratase/isomerase family protein [Deltaproteobacteria bacterium]